MRKRRTNAEVTHDIYQAVEELACSVPLAEITLQMVAKRASMDRKVLYRRYENVEALIRDYSNQYDAMLKELFESGKEIEDKVERYTYIFGRYIEWSTSHHALRTLLLWEFDEAADVGFESGQIRDQLLVELLAEDFSPQPAGSQRELIRQQIILFIAGLTYLYLNRQGAHFMGLPSDTEEARQSLQLSMQHLLQQYFAN